MIVASAAAARAHGLRPRARLLGMTSAGVPPRVMGIGPVPATQTLLARLGLRIDQFDVIELNEAVASHTLAVLRGFCVPAEAATVRPNAGAFALSTQAGLSSARGG